MGLAASLVMAASAFAIAGEAAAFEVSEAAKKEGEVVVATAGGTLQEALAKHLYDDFTAATGIKVTAVTINPQEQWAKIKADTEGGGVQWDLVNVGPDSMVLQQQYLMDLGEDCAAIPNLKANGAPGVCQRFGFLYILGGYILGVSTKAFPDGGPKNSADFFDVAKFPGPRGMASNEPVYNMMIALSADGVPSDKMWPLDIKRALAKMDTLKPYITSWWTSGDQAMQAWRSGEVVMQTFYAGRILALQKEGEKIVPVWSGFPRDISGFGVLKNAPHPNAAKAFIDFFFADESAQRVLDLSNQINYDPPNKKSLELPSPVEAKNRATNPDNWNAMLSLDVNALMTQQRDIEQAWQEWIGQ
jgi:putative spermidine/putrescine transport system substrate-binding protein/mannopine transport system substrate-binding protein